MDNLINNIEAIPLSGEDLQSMAMKLGNQKTAWMPYSQLSKFSDVDSLFQLNRNTGDSKFNTIFVLLEILNQGPKATVGHWISLSFDHLLNIQYYDPYGLSIEQDIAVTGESNLLPNLLKGHDVNVNKHQHQSLRQNQNECGRHCVVKSIFHFLDINDYHDRIILPLIISKQVSTPDVFVSLLTAFLDKSDDVVKLAFSKGQLNKEQGLPVQGRGLGGNVI